MTYWWGELTQVSFTHAHFSQTERKMSDIYRDTCGVQTFNDFVEEMKIYVTNIKIIHSSSYFLHTKMRPSVKMKVDTEDTCLKVCLSVSKITDWENLKGDRVQFKTRIECSVLKIRTWDCLTQMHDKCNEFLEYLKQTHKA